MAGNEPEQTIFFSFNRIITVKEQTTALKFKKNKKGLIKFVKSKLKLWNKSVRFKKFKNVANGGKSKLQNRKFYKKKIKKSVFVI